MRKLVLLTCTVVATVVIMASFAGAQQVSQIDIAAGGSTMFSPSYYSSSVAFVPPPLEGAVYPSFSADVLLDNHFGFNAEGMFRYHQGLYAGYQKFRPIFYDVNGVYTRKVAAKTTVDFMAGLGGESLLFYNVFGSCPSGACRASISSNHLLLHAEFDMRYYFWRKRNLFIRPEAHFYRIVDNTEFSSGNILRLGASIGYTFGR
ncbi:MAG TPA: hypothetical protein VMD99_09925 [Terriglobales bacterium]|nr:hypothetical protein [Terriglobales bacterium]